MAHAEEVVHPSTRLLSVNIKNIAALLAKVIQKLDSASAFLIKT
jgi:hypothetical protein